MYGLSETEQLSEQNDIIAHTGSRLLLPHFASGHDCMEVNQCRPDETGQLFCIEHFEHLENNIINNDNSFY